MVLKYLLLFLTLSFGLLLKENSFKSSFSDDSESIDYGDKGLNCFQVDNPENYHLNENNLTINQSLQMCDCNYKLNWNFDELSINTIIINGTVSRIGNKCFSKFHNVTSIILEEGIEEIGIGTFYGSNIKELIIPSTVTLIQHHAFQNCYQLETVSFDYDSNIQIIE